MKNCIILLSLIFLCIGCTKNNHPVTSTEKKFKIPFVRVHKTKDSIHYFESNYLTPTFPVFAGNYRFADTITFPTREGKRDSSLQKDYLFECWDNVCGDSVRNDGFEIFPDYNHKLNYADWGVKESYYYPVYIVNQTHSTKLFIGKDSYFFGLQEALDSNNEWYPIECRAFDFCGNGYFGLKVHPKEFVLCLFPFYNGTYKTLLRVRIKVGSNIYVSAPYKGTINYKQFHMDKTKIEYSDLLKNPISYIKYNFYDAIPLDVNDKNFSTYAVYSSPR